MLITYKTPDGQEVKVYPTTEALTLYGINFIALKDVPFGIPFKIDGIDSGVGGNFGAGTNRDVVAAVIFNGECWIRWKDLISGEEGEILIN